MRSDSRAVTFEDLVEGLVSPPSLSGASGGGGALKRSDWVREPRQRGQEGLVL